VAVVASGVINLVEQTLRLELRPSVKKGLGLNPANLATEFMESAGLCRTRRWASAQRGRSAVRPRSALVSQTGGVSLLVPSVVGATKEVSVCAHAAAQAPAQAALRGKSQPGR
jgi:hypothetical protein